MIDLKSAPISYYLVLSYLYYIENVSLVTDDEYDELCVHIHENWDSITHPHKYLLDRHLVGIAGTGFYIRDYPARVIGAAEYLRNSNRKTAL